ncbi:MAG: antitoxin [Nitrospinales bacterium]
MSRLSIEITAEQHQRLKAIAALAGKSIKDYVLDRALPPSNGMESISEEEALEKLEEFLKPRIQAAKSGKKSSRSVQEIFEDVERELQ